MNCISPEKTAFLRYTSKCVSGAAEYSDVAFTTVHGSSHMRQITSFQPNITGSTVCPECDSPRVSTRLVPHVFRYGVGDDAVDLDCILPVRSCAQCGAEFVDEEGEAIRHEAVCRHLKLLTPKELRQIREYVGTQAQFRELTGIGEASQSRWETGASFQTKAYDNYLFLLQFHENIGRLNMRRNVREGRPEPDAHVFRCIDITRFRLEQQSKFVLRPAA